MRQRYVRLKTAESVGEKTPPGTGKANCKGGSPTAFVVYLARLLRFLLKKKTAAYRKSKPVYSELEEEEDVATLDGTEDDQGCYGDIIDCDRDSTISEDDSNFCAVCEQVFDTRGILNQHRIRKRHYFCTVCEDIFSDGVELESHKTSTDHYTEEDWDATPATSPSEGPRRRSAHCSLTAELPDGTNEMESLL
ncbi:hypothetical protein BV898_05914 [Hypsibius exemplaris]|uniref:C2H2-type domain-containing protein n=1 Tax=Hypsibius exemplaris TaxID=2072580 RepID=A0A1W0WY38_HYPEX|nr:hypothetical protein BV898_05914 [Hypsibius exemplaris]